MATSFFLLGGIFPFFCFSFCPLLPSLHPWATHCGKLILSNRSSVKKPGYTHTHTCAHADTHTGEQVFLRLGCSVTGLLGDHEKNTFSLIIIRSLRRTSIGLSIRTTFNGWLKPNTSMYINITNLALVVYTKISLDPFPWFRFWKGDFKKM